jgi:multidrug efflux pump
MSQFFILRPVLAWVISIFIVIAGLLSMSSIPVAQYPQVAWPQITVSTSYTGASPTEINQAVAQPIEDELNGVDDLAYYESVSDSSGTMEITVTFEPGTDVARAQVDVQNAVSRVEPLLPQSVVDQGVTVEEASSGFLMMVALVSDDGSQDDIALGDYINRNVVGELRRLEGVGSATLFAPERAMRIWVDPNKMIGLNLTSDDIVAAVNAQNAQAPPC